MDKPTEQLRLDTETAHGQNIQVAAYGDGDWVGNFWLGFSGAACEMINRQSLCISKLERRVASLESLRREMGVFEGIDELTKAMFGE